MYTIGFISAPAWFDPAPSEFPSVLEERVLTQQAPLLLPEFDYRLPSIASVQDELNLCSRSLKAMGCDLVAQVGSPFSWACIKSEDDARARLNSMRESSGLPIVMTGLSIIDRLRLLGVSKIAVCSTYYDSEWRDAFSRFLTLCGFNVVHNSTLSDQGLVPENSKMQDFGWLMTDALARKSIHLVSEASPDAEALIVTGSGTRTLSILNELEVVTKRPIIAADTIVYWAIAHQLGLTLKPIMGSLASRI